MELFHDVKIDWLGKKWYFLGFSLIFSVAGLLSLFFWHGLPQDVDFRGGTVVRVKFAETFKGAQHPMIIVGAAALVQLTARILRVFVPETRMA